MATQVQFRGGSSTEHTSFTGAAREVTVDTTKDTLVVHDGTTAGGHPVAPEDNPEFTGIVSHPLGTASAPTITFTGNTDTGVFSPGTRQLALSTASTSRLHIASDGKIGVGTASPTTTLDVNGDITLNEKLVHSGDTTTFISFPEARAFAVDTNASERLRIDTNGNVGIGTNNPAIKLHVDAGTDVLAGLFSSTGTSTYACFADTNSTAINKVRIGSIGDGMRIFTGGTDSVRIASDGNVGIGTTSPSEKLSVVGNGTFTGTVSAQGSVLTSDQRFKENITDANSQLADVTALGNSLRNWDWTDDAPVADKDARFLGLVAQEAETISPGIVATIARTKDGDELTPEVVVPAVYETLTVPAVLDEEGEVVVAETTEEVLVTEEQVTPATYEQLDDSYKGIKNDVLVMKLLGAVAELSAKVAALEAAN